MFPQSQPGIARIFPVEGRGGIETTRECSGAHRSRGRVAGGRPDRDGEGLRAREGFTQRDVRPEDAKTGRSDDRPVQAWCEVEGLSRGRPGDGPTGRSAGP